MQPNTDVRPTADEIKAVLVETLGIEDRAAAITASTALLDSLPELDSMAVLELVEAIEQRFDILVDDEDVTADVFETLHTLTRFVQTLHQSAALEH